MPLTDPAGVETLQRVEQQRELYARALRSSSRELESRIEELGIVRQLGELFERVQRLEDLADHALPLFFRASRAQHVSILLYAEAAEELVLFARQGRSEARATYYGPQGAPQRLFHVGEGLAGACLAEGEDLSADDVSADARFVPREGGTPVGSLACLPLLCRDKPLGVVCLSHPAPQGLDTHRLPVWRILSGYLAVALSQGQLLQELRSANRKLEERVRVRTRRLEQAKSEISRNNQELQERVQERTGALQTALEELRAQNAHLEEANRVKDEFLNNINHELKTPLNAIIGYAGLLLKEAQAGLAPEQRTDLELIEANGKHLQLILENIFSLKDIEHGTVELDAVPTDLNELIRSAVASLQPRAKEKGLELQFEPLSLPLILLDPTLIRRVVFNLLDNAIKFSQKGKITVRSRLAHRRPGRPQEDCPAEEGGCPFAVVQVTDQGKGIRQENVERIFLKFQQGAPPTKKSEGGSGVGLTIAKNLVELHKGRMWVTSRPDRGSTFGFAIPYES
ncbi:MAG: GAF domain-containing sensor histidine kinase [Deferrisomatales bacterium]|nr:GAF domain-containing sensor histidine kinase [Deferrisomatales bacterium]